jgi:hypothetical protein
MSDKPIRLANGAATSLGFGELTGGGYFTLPMMVSARFLQENSAVDLGELTRGFWMLLDSCAGLAMADHFIQAVVMSPGYFKVSPASKTGVQQ